MSPETRQNAPHSSVKNRRFYSRRDVRSLAYIDLGRDNGGIILNLSEGGLAIHSAIVLKDRRLPHIRFQLPQSTEWIEARGEVAWTSETRMQAGIQVIGLTDHARQQIREWVGATVRLASAEIPKAAPSGLQQPLKPHPANSLRVQTLPTPALPPDPPLPPGLRRREPAANQQKVLKHSEVVQPAFPLAPPASAPNGSKEVSGSIVLPGTPAAGRNASTQLGLRLGQAAPHPRSRPTWMKWAAFAGFLVSMALLSFFAGLRTGKGNPQSLLSGLVTASTRASSTPASQPLSQVPLVGRITVSSRLYVPVSIPSRSDVAKTERLQVGAINYRPDPLYPVDAQKQQTEGTVQLHATIGANGSVEDVSVLSGPPVLTGAASDAVRKWRFTPTQLDGKPVETEADIAIVFWLRPAASNAQTKSK